MSKRTADARTVSALRDLDPATTTLSDAERKRADATLERLLSSRAPDDVPATNARASRRRRWTLIPAVALAAAAAVVMPSFVGGGSAFASWSATPTPLSTPTADAAATTCRAALDVPSTMRAAVAEHRGGWTYVLIDGTAGEAVCLMPDELVGHSDDAVRRRGFFGSFDPDPAEAPTPDRKGVTETESASGAVSLPGRLSLGTVDGWFTSVTGYAGEEVTAVTVHPPSGPDVDASLSGGRFTAWWPAGRARGDNPGVSDAWTYTVALTDGTTQRVQTD